jgi:hypothetical protein
MGKCRAFFKLSCTGHTFFRDIPEFGDDDKWGGYDRKKWGDADNYGYYDLR